jgi:hypothetical protein
MARSLAQAAVASSAIGLTSRDFGQTAAGSRTANRERRWRMRWVPRREVKHDGDSVAALLGLALVLYLAAGAGMAYVAGWGTIGHRLSHAQWWWLGPAFGSILLAFGGYFFAYRGIRSVKHGPCLDVKSRLAVVTAGFGGFLAQGGGALDEYAMRAGGADRREAKVRAMALAGFEQGVLALIVCPAAIAALIVGVGFPRTGFTWPWALIPLPSLLLAAGLSARYRDRLRNRSGWRGKIGLFLDAIDLVVYGIFLSLRTCGPALLGMLAYWGGDMFGLWAATAAFGYRMSALAVIVGLGSGMILTRRTAPLGGAGFLSLALIPTLWYGSGVPFAAATLGVLAYRLFTMWVPVIPGLIALPALRAIGEQAEDTPHPGTHTTKGEPALQH